MLPLACRASSSDLLDEGIVWQEYVSLESKFDDDFPRDRAIKLCKSAVVSLQNDFDVLVGVTLDMT